MPIEWVRSVTDNNVPRMFYPGAGNSFTYLQGDVVGLMSGTSAQTDASPAGTARRFGANVGGAGASFPIVLASGVLGIVTAPVTSDASGNAITPTGPTGVLANVQPVLALNSMSNLAAPSIAAGVQRNVVPVAVADQNSVFQQRHKKGTRINDGLLGKLAALTFNSTTKEFEVDTTAGSPCVVITRIEKLTHDNYLWFDSSTFASDAFGAWVEFQFIDSVQALPNGLTYAT